MQGAAFARDGHRVGGKAQTRPLVSGPCLDHAVARLRSPAGLRDDQREGLPQLAFQSGEDLVHTVRVSVVEEIRYELVGARLSERLGHELRTEGRPPDSDDQNVFEGSGGANPFSAMHLGGESANRLQRALNGFSQGRRGSQRRIPQPVMAHHPLFIRIGDGTPFQLSHVAQCFLDGPFHFGVEIVRKRDPTDVES